MMASCRDILFCGVILFSSQVFSLPTEITPNSTDVADAVKAINALPMSGSSNSNLGIIGQPDPFNGILSAFLGTRSGPAPASVEDALSSLSSIDSGTTTNLYTNLAKMVSMGMTDPSVDLVAVSKGKQLTGPKSTNNNNPKAPAAPVFPQKAAGDAPYSLDEAKLRAAIFIPETFTYGQKPPVILTPGTGNVG